MEDKTTQKNEVLGAELKRGLLARMQRLQPREAHDRKLREVFGGFQKRAMEVVPRASARLIGIVGDKLAPMAQQADSATERCAKLEQRMREELHVGGMGDMGDDELVGFLKKAIELVLESKEARAEAEDEVVLEMEVDEEELAKMMLRSVKITARRGDLKIFSNESIEGLETRAEAELRKELQAMEQRLGKAHETVERLGEEMEHAKAQRERERRHREAQMNEAVEEARKKEVEAAKRVAAVEKDLEAITARMGQEQKELEPKLKLEEAVIRKKVTEAHGLWRCNDPGSSLILLALFILNSFEKDLSH